MTICLSRDELFELSGYKQRRKVSEWLRANGIKFYIGGDAWPRVLRDSLAVAPKAGNHVRRTEPNFAALQELQSRRKYKKSVKP